MKVSAYIRKYGLKAFEKSYPSEVGVYTETGKAIEQARPLEEWQTYEEYKAGIPEKTRKLKTTTYKLKTNGLQNISKEMAESLISSGKYRIGSYKPAGTSEFTTIDYPKFYGAGAGGSGIEGMSWTAFLKWGAVGLLGILALPTIISVFKKR